jgi:hypothetical protein
MLIAKFTAGFRITRMRKEALLVVLWSLLGRNSIKLKLGPAIPLTEFSIG